jgi:hypothetical protein
MVAEVALMLLAETAEITGVAVDVLQVRTVIE